MNAVVRSMVVAGCSLFAPGVTAQEATASRTQGQPSTQQSAPQSAWLDRTRLTPDDAAQLATGSALDAALLRVHAALRAGPFAQRVSIEHRDHPLGLDAPQLRGSASVLVHVVPGPRSQVRIEAPPLVLRSTDDEERSRAVLEGVSTLNPERCWRHTVPDGLSLLDACERALPPLPLATMHWALQPESMPPLAREPIAGEARWLGVTRDGSRIVGERCVLAIDTHTNLPIAMVIDVGGDATDAVALSAGRARSVLVLGFEALGDPTMPTLDLTGRIAVESLADLVPLAAELAPGAAMPVLPLLDASLQGWTGLDDFLTQAREEARSGQASRPRFALLLCFDAKSEAALASAHEAAHALDAVARTMNLRFLRGRSLAPRVLTAGVAMLDLPDVRTPLVQSLTEPWGQRLGPASKAVPLVVSSGGTRLLDRFARGSRAFVLVLDAEGGSSGRLREVFPIDLRAPDREGLARELLAAIPDPGESTTEPRDLGAPR